MKIIKILFICILFTNIALAQKIKVKKGELLINDKAVALVDGSGKDKMYTFKTLTGEIVFYADFKQKKLSATEIFETIELRKNTAGTPNIIEAKQFSLSLFDYTKYVCENLILGQNKLIDENGFRNDDIQSFFNTKTTATPSDEVKNAAKYENISKNLTVIIDNDGKIRNGENYIGMIFKSDSIVKRENLTDLSVTNYKVFDIDNNLIGKLTSFNLSPALKEKNKKVLDVLKDNIFKAFTGQEINMNYLEMHDSKSFEDKIIKGIIKEGLVLAHQYNEMSGQKIDIFKTGKSPEAVKEKLEKKNEEKNIIDQPGFVIDKDGNKIAGSLNINFVEPKSDDSFSGGNVVSLGGGDYGKTVKLKYVDAKGKKQKDNFKSKDGIKFCTEIGGITTCYLGLKVEGNQLDKAQDMMKLSFDGSLFYKVIFEKDNNYLLQDVINNNLIIKIKSQQKGITTKNDLDLIKTEALTEYFNCKSLLMTSHDLTNKVGLIKLLENYIEICK